MQSEKQIYGIKVNISLASDKFMTKIQFLKQATAVNYGKTDYVKEG